mmetsp:Transcript_35556/g.100659  ORF Transcript_35556/g.100659 Transcript_35556/m.100659 type:complete len:84 (+) Transcript_35556:1213-1464(+)
MATQSPNQPHPLAGLSSRSTAPHLAWQRHETSFAYTNPPKQEPECADQDMYRLPFPAAPFYGLVVFYFDLQGPPAMAHYRSLL